MDGAGRRRRGPAAGLRGRPRPPRNGPRTTSRRPPRPRRTRPPPSSTCSCAGRRCCRSPSASAATRSPRPRPGPGGCCRTPGRAPTCGPRCGRSARSPATGPSTPSPRTSPSGSPGRRARRRVWSAAAGPYLLGVVCYFTGRLAEADGHLSTAVDRLAAIDPRLLREQAGRTPALAAYNFRALVRSLRGDPGAALADLDAAAALAERLRRPVRPGQRRPVRRLDGAAGARRRRGSGRRPALPGDRRQAAACRTSSPPATSWPSGRPCAAASTAGSPRCGRRARRSTGSGCAPPVPSRSPRWPTRTSSPATRTPPPGSRRAGLAEAAAVGERVLTAELRRVRGLATGDHEDVRGRRRDRRGAGRPAAAGPHRPRGSRLHSGSTPRLHATVGCWHRPRHRHTDVTSWWAADRSARSPPTCSASAGCGRSSSSAAPHRTGSPGRSPATTRRCGCTSRRACRDEVAADMYPPPVVEYVSGDGRPFATIALDEIDFGLGSAPLHFFDQPWLEAVAARRAGPLPARRAAHRAWRWWAWTRTPTGSPCGCATPPPAQAARCGPGTCWAATAPAAPPGRRRGSS